MNTKTYKSSKGTIFTKDFLIEQHYNLNKSALQIAIEFGSSGNTVLRRIKFHGIVLRGNSIKKGVSNVKNFKHGKCKTSTYKSWYSMKQRCLNKNSDSYILYGGRGIKISDSWMIFDNFLADMGEKQINGLSIDRINPNGNYEKDNCRWATSKEQQQNRRDTRKLTIDGYVGTVREWSELSGTDFKTISNRYSRGWSHRECVYGQQLNILN